ncbi:hypothetical protein NITLEN_100086 [Nitrospira lenta]|uniref:Uncharacterized protein n=1 Tax=Nitrospira lenta TaxID=1436998 RepID=A0A330L327_9BACT|nr:hypothetical protein NITLEN_100086 [Nitrospira lenta]
MRGGMPVSREEHAVPIKGRRQPIMAVVMGARKNLPEKEPFGRQGRQDIHAVMSPLERERAPSIGIRPRRENSQVRRGSSRLKN